MSCPSRPRPAGHTAAGVSAPVALYTQSETLGQSTAGGLEGGCLTDLQAIEFAPGVGRGKSLGGEEEFYGPRQRDIGEVRVLESTAITRHLKRSLSFPYCVGEKERQRQRNRDNSQTQREGKM